MLGPSPVAPVDEHHRRGGPHPMGPAEQHAQAIGERPYLRARRRVRQRVDAGEPRNTYSSIPGFSFRSGSGPQQGNSSSFQQRLAHFHGQGFGQQFPFAQAQQQPGQQYLHPGAMPRSAISAAANFYRAAAVAAAAAASTGPQSSTTPSTSTNAPFAHFSSPPPSDACQDGLRPDADQQHSSSSGQDMLLRHPHLGASFPGGQVPPPPPLYPYMHHPGQPRPPMTMGGGYFGGGMAAAAAACAAMQVRARFLMHRSQQQQQHHSSQESLLPNANVSDRCFPSLPDHSSAKYNDIFQHNNNNNSVGFVSQKNEADSSADARTGGCDAKRRSSTGGADGDAGGGDANAERACCSSALAERRSPVGGEPARTTRDSDADDGRALEGLLEDRGADAERLPAGDSDSPRAKTGDLSEGHDQESFEEEREERKDKRARPEASASSASASASTALPPRPTSPTIASEAAAAAAAHDCGQGKATETELLGASLPKESDVSEETRDPDAATVYPLVSQQHAVEAPRNFVLDTCKPQQQLPVHLPFPRPAAVAPPVWGQFQPPAPYPLFAPRPFCRVPQIAASCPPLPPPLHHAQQQPGHAQGLLREILHGKLALAAAVAQRSFLARQQQSACGDPNMEPSALGLVGPLANGHAAANSPRDFSAASRHNNNELKDNAALMAQIMKMQQAFALNMSRDAQKEAEEIRARMNRRRKLDEDDEALMDEEALLRVRSNDDMDDDGDDMVGDDDVDDEDQPMDLKSSKAVESIAERSSSVQSGSDAEIHAATGSPHSPLSDAGMSSSSGKDSKTARLEHIVSSMRSSPHGGQSQSQLSGVNGCKKRKLYQPVQQSSHTSPRRDAEDENGDPESPSKTGDFTDLEDKRFDEPEKKKSRDLEASLVSRMQEQLSRLQQRSDKETAEILGMNALAAAAAAAANTHESKRHSDEMLDLRRKPVKAPAANPFLNFNLPLQPVRENNNQPVPIHMHYMELARRLMMQEQQDKLTKEVITKEIINDTILNNREIEDKLTALNPELKGLAGILKSEITASLAVIIDSIVSRFLQTRRQQQQTKPFTLDDPIAALKQTGLLDSSPRSNNPQSGRAPQVRDRTAPRVATNPVSMANPQSVNTMTPSHHLPQMPQLHRPPSMPGMDDKYSQRSPSLPDDDSDNMPEQDEALSLVVMPKKKRHKVTDTRLTPRSASRSQLDADLVMGKPFPERNAGSNGSAAAPLNFHKSPSVNELPSPRPLPLFPGLPPHFLPTSVAIPNPSLHDFSPFSPFYSQAVAASAAAAAAAAAANLSPRVPSAVVPASPSPSTEKTSVRDRGGDRGQGHHRRRPGVAPAPERDSPSSALLHHASLLGPDYASLREASESAQEEYERVQSSFHSLSSYSLSGDGHCSSTLTPMHLRKAKLMFFWVRYPSSAIIKMYFPDIKFNKNNTAQLVKWFSNFREFYYIQMEKYARQAMSEGVKHPEEIHVSADSELYRVINLHYNRNNHIEIPEHFLPVVEVTLREFFISIREGKDEESSWKKQIYKVIQRYDEPIPEYFKTPEFLKQLE